MTPASENSMSVSVNFLFISVSTHSHWRMKSGICKGKATQLDQRLKLGASFQCEIIIPNWIAFLGLSHKSDCKLKGKRSADLRQIK